MRQVVCRLAAIAALSVGASMTFAEGARVSKTDAPSGLESVALDWIQVDTPANGTLLAAISLPKGHGPFPAVLIVHGSHGFAREYLHLAREISTQGFIAIAACWFRGGIADGGDVSEPIDCPGARPIPMGPSDQARATLADLVDAARQLPDVRTDRIAIFGHSRGAGATVNYLEHGGDVRAAVLNSSGYADEYITNVTRIQARVLVLHGRQDTNSDLTRIERAEQFGAAMRAARIPVETHFYPAGVHRGIFVDHAQHDDEVRRIVKFLRKELR